MAPISLLLDQFDHRSLFLGNDRGRDIRCIPILSIMVSTMALVRKKNPKLQCSDQ